MKNQTRKRQPRAKTRLVATGACLGLMVSGGMAAYAQTTIDAEKMAEMQKRLDALEDLVKKEGLMPSGPTNAVVSAMNQITISGFVQTSYFYNTQRPASGQSDTYLWNTKDNSFSMNKSKLTIASAPVATDKWDAGFRAFTDVRR